MVINKLILFVLVVVLFGCFNNKPSSDVINDEFKKIEVYIQAALSSDYKISDKKIIKTYFISKNECKVEISFRLNKQFISEEPIIIKGFMIFARSENSVWYRKYNSIEDIGILNLIN
ncbi:MAG TPA: hypothetical protein PL041_12195 [Melioribacteraceae bacterium]|nr:hypothetical protein [Melioribacteraceae bacterium]